MIVLKDPQKDHKRPPLFPNPHPRNSRLWEGKRIGILGGSFNPPHNGHALIASEAMKRFNLHCVWWMVSPKNPLKSTSGHTDFQRRFQQTKDFITHPKMIATDIEQQLGTPYSHETIVQLQKRFPKTDFIWIAGMDNAVLFHRWNHWRDLVERIPFVFFNRPPSYTKLNNVPLKMVRDVCNKMEPRGVSTLEKSGLYWVYEGHCKDISSTELRGKN